jgi:hypothetical protein
MDGSFYGMKNRRLSTDRPYSYSSRCHTAGTLCNTIYCLTQRNALDLLQIWLLDLNSRMMNAQMCFCIRNMLKDFPPNLAYF